MYVALTRGEYCIKVIVDSSNISLDLEAIQIYRVVEGILNRTHSIPLDVAMKSFDVDSPARKEYSSIMNTIDTQMCFLKPFKLR